MDKLNFYHQMRGDGGLRSGIDFNDLRVLESYEPGTQPQNSALLWFIDVRCSAEHLPSEPELIRHWFLDRSEIIRMALRKLAEEISIGIDSGWPLKRDIAAKDGVLMAVYCSAIRRLTGREMTEALSSLESNWCNLINGLGNYEHSALAHG
jgi:hypothetical protein